jgi:hypothetical protein
MQERSDAMAQVEPPDFRPPEHRRSSFLRSIVLLLVIAAVAYGGWRWWEARRATPPPEPVAATPGPAPQDGAPPAPPAAAASGPQFPVAQSNQPLPPLADSDARVRTALAELLGSKAVASFLQTDGFVRRSVATVDNLSRTQAPPSRWPVQPTPRRFGAKGEGDAQTIDLDNSARYTPFVLFAESVDPAKAAALYRELYPLFQQAYEELGYPGKYFNDRLVAVIDHLLQAPEPAGPLRVKLTEVKGDVPAAQPWTRYEFADPQLEALSAGQKTMVRMGLVNERRMKSRLKELRAQVATGNTRK